MSTMTGNLIYCRVCLQTDPEVEEKFTSLFDKYNNSWIFEIINSIADVKIQQDDGLPSRICPNCLSELNTVVHFKTKCENSNILLNTSLVCNQQRVEQEQQLNQPAEEIKEEEPDECEVYNNTDTEYFEDYEFMEDNSYKIDINVEVEPKADENGIENTIVKKSKAIDLKLECNECGGFFKSKCKMRVHWKKVHMYESLICLLCKRTFKNYKSFNLHKRKQPKACITASKANIEGSGKSRVFHCKKCDYFTRKIITLQAHLVTHTGERPFNCNKCTRSFTQLTTLQDHMETVHQMVRKETNCVICGKYLRGRRQIYGHMKIHRTKRVQCDICKKMLKSKTVLIEHLKRHTGVKSYTCDKCGKTFYCQSDLSIHVRNIHEKGKHIYTCNICGYKVYDSRVLRNHESRHTGTNIPCLECGMFLENAQKLMIHQRRHFGEKNSPCPHCEKRFIHRNALSKHVRKVHKCKFLVNKPEQ